MIWPGFCGPTYQSQSSVILGERCINLYPQPIDGAGKTSIALYPCPSFRAFGGSGAPGENRALFAQDDAAYGVWEDRVNGWRTFIPLAGPSALGVTLARNDRQAAIASNGAQGGQIAIASGGLLYIYTVATNTVAQAFDTDGAAVLSDIVLFLDGYFVSLNVAAQEFQISALFDGDTWDPADVAKSTASSDAWVNMSKSDRTLWLIGSQTAQPWYNNGNVDFPFAPFEGAFIETGCAAIDSVARFGQEDSGPIFLSTSESGGYSFRHLNGYTPQRISSEGVEYAISLYGDVSDAVAFTESYNGQNFYVCTFPRAKACWAWSPTGGWHERLDWTVDGEWAAYPFTGHCFFNGQHLYGTNETDGVIWRGSSVVVNAMGAGPSVTRCGRRVRQTPVLSREGSIVKVPRITLDVETGFGNRDIAGDPDLTANKWTPSVSMQLSRNGGKTWGTERSKSLGRIGDYSKQVYWDMNGQGRAIVGRIVMTDPTYFRIANAYLGRP